MSSENENWVLGVTLGLLGSVAINTGNNIQSLGLKALQSQEKVEPEPTAIVKRTSSLPSLPWQSPCRGRGSILKSNSVPWLSPTRPKTHPVENEEEFVVVKVGRKSPFQSVTWVIGTIIFVSGSLLNFVAFAYAAQSMLASLESVQFVTNLLFGKFLLGAHVTQTMLAGKTHTVTPPSCSDLFNIYPLTRCYHQLHNLRYLPNCHRHCHGRPVLIQRNS